MAVVVAGLGVMLEPVLTLSLLFKFPWLVHNIRFKLALSRVERVGRALY